MKIQELIKQLEKFNPEAEIKLHLFDQDGEGYEVEINTLEGDEELVIMNGLIEI